MSYARARNSEKCARAVYFTFVANDSETGRHLGLHELPIIKRDYLVRFHHYLIESTAINHNFGKVRTYAKDFSSYLKFLLNSCKDLLHHRLQSTNKAPKTRCKH